MSENEALLRSAEADRIACRYQAAISKYRQWLMDHPNDHAAMNNLGICLVRSGQEHEGRRYMAAAKALGSKKSELVRYYRDDGEAASRQGKTEEAERLLTTALDMCPILVFDEEWAITIGFIARNEFRQGHIGHSLKLFATADRELRAGSSRHYELYNALHYALALSKATKRGVSRRIATRAFILSWQYGGWPHRARALAILIGGWRLEAALCNRRV